jgi:hypothetical protein
MELAGLSGAPPPDILETHIQRDLIMYIVSLVALVCLQSICQVWSQAAYSNCTVSLDDGSEMLPEVLL